MGDAIWWALFSRILRRFTGWDLASGVSYYMKGKAEKAVEIVDESLLCFDVVQVGHVLFVADVERIERPLVARPPLNRGL